MTKTKTYTLEGFCRRGHAYEEVGRDHRGACRKCIAMYREARSLGQTVRDPGARTYAFDPGRALLEARRGEAFKAYLVLRSLEMDRVDDARRWQARFGWADPEPDSHARVLAEAAAIRGGAS